MEKTGDLKNLMGCILREIQALQKAEPREKPGKTCAQTEGLNRDNL